MGENIELDLKAIPPAPVPNNVVSQIVNLEIDYRNLSSADHERQKDFLRRSIQEADKQVVVLSSQKQANRGSPGGRARPSESQNSLRQW